ncbi:hypothetical protein K7G98_20690 [Saccharothrix sp. MB29]|nr:hypothetical protein [Saccharothrix sp. MB29]
MGHALPAVADAGNRWIFPGGRRWAGVRRVAMLASPGGAVDVSRSVGWPRSWAHRAYLNALGAADVRTPLTGLFGANGRRATGARRSRWVRQRRLTRAARRTAKC